MLCLRAVSSDADGRSQNVSRKDASKEIFLFFAAVTQE
jgi:hypothetical protein